MKKIIKYIVLAALCLAATGIFPEVAEAGSGRIEFSASSDEIKKGEEFTVICRLTSADTFLDAEFQIVYDADVLRFVKGGKKVSGGDGILHISSTGNDTAVNKKTFSLQFLAEKKGNTMISVEGDIKVLGEDGSTFSISSNQLLISVVKKVKQKKDGESAAQEPDRKAGNNPPGEGDEVVRPEDTPGPTPEPTAKVTKKPKSSPTPTVEPTPALPEDKEEKVRDIPFGVTSEDGKITLKNSYEFEVADPSQVESVPAGYIQSNIELDGVTIPAYTMERDLDNNYLLLYLKGPSGETLWYQYDRQEKTLQRYTGDMIKKVNRSAGRVDSNAFPISNYVLFGIIVFLIIVILCMMIAMLKMAMKKKDVF